MYKTRKQASDAHIDMYAEALSQAEELKQLIKELDDTICSSDMSDDYDPEDEQSKYEQLCIAKIVHDYYVSEAELHLKTALKLLDRDKQYPDYG